MLSEKYLKTLEGSKGAFEVFENPTIEEIQEILNIDDESANFYNSSSLRADSMASVVVN